MIVGWGGYPKAISNDITALANLQFNEREHFIPIGNLRSYGDEAMAVKKGIHIDCKSQDYFYDFDQQTGILYCQSGVLLQTILDTFIAQGWFLPCVPGTALITVGGAIANDVHGKNHANVGSFGDNVMAIDLLKSDGQAQWIDRNTQPDLFAATIGGLGLTGVITAAKIQLRRVQSSFFDVTNIKYAHLDDFFALSQEFKNDYEYSVAWVDCLADEKNLGRGHFTIANHSQDEQYPLRPNRTKSVPITLPFSAINATSVKAFNKLYYHRQRNTIKVSREHYHSYLFPLDGIHHWNRLYGKKGFVQFQCVIPPASAPEAIRLLLTRVKESGSGSFLAVLKQFGERRGIGLLSFPRPGTTLAIDFAVSDKNFALLTELDAIVRDYEGAIYLAKDARSAANLVAIGYPEIEQFKQWIDPKMASLLSKRLGITP